MAFLKDEGGIMCLIITYLAVFYADYVVTLWIIMYVMGKNPWTLLHLILFNIDVILLITAHLQAVFSDPGIVPLQRDLPDNSELTGWTFCLKCESYRPPRAHHCRTCKKCIRRMDHHCPWINSCVGEKNQKYFLQFLLYVAILSIYSAGLVIYAWTYPSEDSQNMKIHSVFLMVESAAFGLFAIGVFMDQIDSVLRDETGIEALQQKGSSRAKRNPCKLDNMPLVFGNGSPVFWLCPCNIRLKKKTFEEPLPACVV